VFLVLLVFYGVNVNKIINTQQIFLFFFIRGYTTPYYATLFKAQRVKAIEYK